MGVITLTSDWGAGNHYAAAVKGAILTQYAHAVIVDISHDVPTFNILQASFIIKNCFSNFPLGTVHLIGLNSEASIETPHVAVLYQGHYFVGSDNGIFPLIFTEKPEKIVELNVIQDSDYFTFSSRDVFAKTACHLAQGGKMEELGTVVTKLKELHHPQPVSDKDLIKGTVIFVDSYENVFTNISKSLFKEIGKGRSFTIYFGSYGDIRTLSAAYNDVPQGEKLVLFSSTGLLQIAQNQAKASSLLGLKLNDTVRIEFDN